MLKPAAVSALMTSPLTGVEGLLRKEPAGLACDFTSSPTGDVLVKDPAGILNKRTTADGFFTQAGTSPKLCNHSDGVLRWAPHNLILQSQTFGTTWAVGGVAAAISANAGVAPDGTATADALLGNDGGAGQIRVQQNVSLPLQLETYTFSVYAKANGASWIRLDAQSMGAYAYNAFFQLSGAGAIGATLGANNLTQAIESVGNGWYRCSISFIANDSDVGGSWGIWIADGDNDITTSGSSALSVLLWGAQINRGAVPTDYLATTTAAKYGCAIDYSNGSYGLLVEPAATNVILQSSAFGTTWDVEEATVTSNTSTAPDGTATADTITESTNNTLHAFYQQPSGGIAGGTVITISCYLKAGTRNYATLLYSDFGDDENHIASVFDLSTGALGETDVGTSSGTITSSSITAVGNGWYRCALTGSIATTANEYVGVFITVGASGNTFDGFGEPSHTGTSSTILAWGFQCETGTVATSPIPTTTAAVTRAVDKVSVATSAFPLGAGLVGTVLAAGQFRIATNTLGNNMGVWGMNASTTTPSLDKYDTSNHIAFRGLGLNVDTSLLVGTSVFKIGTAMGPADVAVVLGGGTPYTNVTGSGNFGAATTLALGDITTFASPMQGWIRQIVYLPRRMTNAELVARTAT